MVQNSQPKGHPLEKDELNKRTRYTTWTLLKSYWESKQKGTAYLFLVVILTMTITLVGFDVAFNYWYKYFYNALQAYNLHDTLGLLIIFCGMAFLNIVLAVYRYYIAQLFGLRWRRWMTNQFIGKWLRKRSYYYLENFDEKTDNPDQRIQEDIALLVQNTIDLTTGIVSAITTFFAFMYILWSLSGHLHISLGSLGTLDIPGYLMWIAIIYAAMGTFFTFKVGKPLVALNFEQQRREATFRYAAIDLRTHAEHVALYRGEKHQKSILHKLFGNVLDNWYMIILRQKLLLWFTSGYNQISVLLPLAVALPNYFNKVFKLGGLIQSLSAFSSVQTSLSFLVNSFTTIAQWRAINQRLITFLNHINEVDEKAEEADHLRIHRKPQDVIAANQITVTTPQDKMLLQNIDETFIHGSNYWLKGESGIGKSTFVRTLAGIWPFASGELTYPQNKQVMYLPQKPYMPIGTLAEAILFPDKHHPDMEQKLTEVLKDCRLEHLVPRLFETANWNQQLSPGEQQRIAFARILLHKPDWVFLDESTSMLDISNEKSMYELLKNHLPQCSIISIGHRPSLESYHDKVIDMGRYATQT